MSLPRPSGTIFLSSSLSPRHTATHGARERSAGNERLSPCTGARYQNASKRTRSRVSARSRPPRSPQKFARENRSRDPPLPHEHRLTLANVKWRPLLTSFSTLVRICPSSDSATMAVTLDRAADWPSRSRDAPGVRDWTPRLAEDRNAAATSTPPVGEPPLCTARFRGAVVRTIMAVYRPDARRGRSVGSLASPRSLFSPDGDGPVPDSVRARSRVLRFKASRVVSDSSMSPHDPTTRRFRCGSCRSVALIETHLGEGGDTLLIVRSPTVGDYLFRTTRAVSADADRTLISS